MLTLIKNGNVVTFDKVEKADILIENDVIKQIGKDINAKADKVIDASGKHVFAGFVDMHVHLREPGFEGKEDMFFLSSMVEQDGTYYIESILTTQYVPD